MREEARVELALIGQEFEHYLHSGVSKTTFERLVLRALLFICKCVAR